MDWNALTIIAMMVTTTGGMALCIKHDINRLEDRLVGEMAKLDERHREDVNKLDERHREDMRASEERWKWLFEKIDNKLENLKDKSSKTV